MSYAKMRVVGRANVEGTWWRSERWSWTCPAEDCVLDEDTQTYFYGSAPGSVRNSNAAQRTQTSARKHWQECPALQRDRMLADLQSAHRVEWTRHREAIQRRDRDSRIAHWYAICVIRNLLADHEEREA